MTAGGRGDKANAIGSKTFTPSSRCNLVHNGVVKSGIWLVTYGNMICVCCCVFVYVTSVESFKNIYNIAL
jgi:hypothetical protein